MFGNTGRRVAERRANVSAHRDAKFRNSSAQSWSVDSVPSPVSLARSVLCARLTHVESAPLPVSLDQSKAKRKEGTAAMKNQAIHYLGLDVHQATIVATCRNESGAIVLKATVPTEAKAIVGMVRGQGPRVHVAFEEGTQAQWLHDLLQPVAERVIVCNVRGKRELVNKKRRP
jgi:hypothetical protein